MTNICDFIEHTLLKQDATEAELKQLFKEAIDNKFLGICVNPCFVSMAKEYLKDFIKDEFVFYQM